jgi:hypothetical protein
VACCFCHVGQCLRNRELNRDIIALGPAPMNARPACLLACALPARVYVFAVLPACTCSTAHWQSLRSRTSGASAECEPSIQPAIYYWLERAVFTLHVSGGRPLAGMDAPLLMTSAQLWSTAAVE